MEFAEALDNASQIDWSGQLDGAPGGGSGYNTFIAADPSGSTGLYMGPILDFNTGAPTTTDVNPNPTGGWQQTVADILKAASNAFVVYEKGSPAAVTPGATPGQKPASQVPPAGAPPRETTITLPVSGGVIAIVGIGALALFFIAKG